MSIDLDIIWKQFDELTVKSKEYNNENNKKCLCEEQELIYTDCSDIVCNNCGLVLENFNISNDAEWRTFKDDNGFNDGGNRVGMPVDTLMPKMSMSTVIGGPNSRMRNLNMWMSMPYDERVILNIKYNLIRITTLNNLPSFLISDTLHKYKNFYTSKNKLNNNNYRGKHKTGLISVCFYYSCRNRNLNISIPYICNYFEIDKPIFSKCCKIYDEIIKSHDNTIINSFELLERFSNILNLSFHVKKLAKNIVISCENLNIFPTNTVQSLISGVLYFINTEMSLNLNKKIIASTCDVSDMTVIKIFKILKINRLTIFNYIKENK